MTFDLAKRRAELTPARPAVYWQGRWYSYLELNARAERLAARLAEAGVGRGDRVSILAQNHLAHLDLVLATPKLGFVYAPLNYRLRPAEQRAIAQALRPSLLLFAAAQREGAEASGVKLQPLESYESWLAGASAAPSAPELGPEDPQMILLTGGTTGTPKGAVQPYRQSFYNAVNTVFSWGLSEDDSCIQATPCFHAAVNALSLPLLHLGARVVLEPAFEPGDYLRLLAETRPSLMFLVPTMYRMLADAPGFAAADFSSIRWAISGGAPCPEPLRQAYAARGLRFKQGYGLTEAGVNCFAIELDAAERRPASVGKPVLYAEAVIRRPGGEPAPAGEVGELTLRGPHLFSGYFERPEATAEVLRDGWLWTGDLARQDEDGFFYLAGRRKELFISGGENVFPVEVENVLYTHPDVAECAVTGVPDERWGEVGLAVVVPKAGSSLRAEALRSHLKARLAGYKVPKHLRFAASLPKSAAGKVLKAELPALLGETEDV